MARTDAGADNMKMDPYSTHQALLVSAMNATTGTIVEMGGGWYSTPLVNSFAELGGRQAYTIETGDFVFNILKRYQGQHHRVHIVDGFTFDQVGKFKGQIGKSKLDYISIQSVFLERFWREDLKQRRVSVAFVDQAPGFLRVPALEFFADKADYVITHDTEHVDHYGFEPTLSAFKSRWDFRLHKPNSVILSNFQDCTIYKFLDRDGSMEPDAQGAVIGTA